ncbi:MAG: hypothetical protein CVU05_05625 [Bacteroidetes bacterium HGW-Bacteroidetes-21]|jgi:hypothetical protein|nr:MAG: hypothetical protein CVU05_05625 [Bacteroidetes bacterium HGW-Bacteroidetes-21]
MSNLILFICFICPFVVCNVNCFSQHSIDAVANNEVVHEIMLEDKSNGDLSFLKTVVGNKRIVLIGEEGHRVPEFNELNTQIISFLHKELGFNILIYESGFNELACVSFLRDTIESETAMNTTLHGVWRTSSVIPQFEIQKQDSNFYVFGIDFPSSACKRSSYYFYNIINNKSHETANDFLAIDTTMFSFLINQVNCEKIINDSEKEAAYNSLKSEGLEKTNIYNNVLLSITKGNNNYNKLDSLFTTRAIINRIAYIKWLTDEKRSFRYRDSIMFSNLEWYINEVFPNEKFIVIAHNAHISKKYNQYKGSSLGELIANKNSNEYMVILKNYFSGYNKAGGDSVKTNIFVEYDLNSMTNNDVSYFDLNRIANNNFSVKKHLKRKKYVGGVGKGKILELAEGIILFKKVTLSNE